MPKKKTKSTEEHLQTVEYLLAGLLLGRKPGVKQVAKIIGESDDIITDMFPAAQSRKRAKTKVKEQSENV